MVVGQNEVTTMRKKREGMMLWMAQRRSELLRQWVEAHTTQSEIARRSGCTRQYVSWLIRNPFGYDAARSVEEKFGLPKYALEPSGAMHEDAMS